MSAADWLALTSSPAALAVMAAVVYADAFLVVVPGEAAVTAMGAVAASTGVPPLAAVVAVAAAAAFCGDASCYALGRVIGIRGIRRPRLRRALDRAALELQRRGAVILFTARFVPFARLAVNLAAGAARTSPLTYFPLAATAAAGWALVQAVLGAVIAALVPGGPVVAVIISVGAALLIGLAVDAAFALVRRGRARRTPDDSASAPGYSPRNGIVAKTRPMTTEIDDSRALDEIKDRLATRFPDRTSDEIGAVVDEIHRGMSEARVKDFVPVLVEKAAAKRLKS